jgi:hypothetical protein
VKQHLSAEEARVQAAELLRKAKLKREKEEAEVARIREREVRGGQHLQQLLVLVAQVMLQLDDVSTSVAATGGMSEHLLQECVGAVAPVTPLCCCGSESHREQCRIER